MPNQVMHSIATFPSRVGYFIVNDSHRDRKPSGYVFYLTSCYLICFPTCSIFCFSHLLARVSIGNWNRRNTKKNTKKNTQNYFECLLCQTSFKNNSYRVHKFLNS